jgi:hypothetical protein
MGKKDLKRTIMRHEMRIADLSATNDDLQRILSDKNEVLEKLDRDYTDARCELSELSAKNAELEKEFKRVYEQQGFNAQPMQHDDAQPLRGTYFKDRTQTYKAVKLTNMETAREIMSILGGDSKAEVNNEGFIVVFSSKLRKGQIREGEILVIDNLHDKTAGNPCMRVVQASEFRELYELVLLNK